jgi:hypothetical protein
MPFQTIVLKFVLKSPVKDMRLVIEINSQKDANLLVSLVKRLKGTIIGEGPNAANSQKGAPSNAIASLETISKRSGIASIKDPTAWQRETRQDRKLEERDS